MVVGLHSDLSLKISPATNHGYRDNPANELLPGISAVLAGENARAQLMLRTNGPVSITVLLREGERRPRSNGG
jgi:hypothetical protein